MRRRSVSRKSALSHAKWTRFVQQTQTLNSSSTPEVIDAGLDEALVRLYLNGHGVGDARLMYYGVRWSYSLTNALLRLSYHSLQGYTRQFRAVTRRPVTWESVMLMALALLTLAGPEVALAERLFGAAAFLLGFDLYARGATSQQPRPAN